MPREKGKKNTPPNIIAEIIFRHREGATKKYLSEEYQIPFKTIKSMIRRDNINKKNPSLIFKSKKGRPRKTPLTDEHAKDLRIKELERELELYKSFLHAAGRM